MVACEDTLSGYSVRDASDKTRRQTDPQHAVDFFQAICNLTSGVMLPLTTADLLAMTIVGSVLENMDMERLVAGEYDYTGSRPSALTVEIGNEVAQRVRSKGETMQSVEEVAQ